MKISCNDTLKVFCVALSLFFYSCEEETTGYISLRDPDAPEIELLNISDHQIILDTLSNYPIQVRAKDFFGISQVYLSVNGKVVAPWQNQAVRTVVLSASLAIDTSLIGKENTIYALARDASSNTATTLPITFTVQRTLVNKNNTSQISIFDRGSISDVDLDTIFVDTLTQSTVTYQLIGNTNPKIIQPELVGTTLRFNPKPYLSGQSTVTIKASVGKRFIIQKFNIQIGLIAPVKKVFMPDSVFRNLLRDKYGFTDLQEDSIVQDQADTLQNLSIVFPGLKNFEGIQSFINLKEAFLSAYPNSNAYCDIKKCVQLKYLYFEYFGFNNIKTSTLNNLESLIIAYSGGDSLDLTSYPNLKTLHTSLSYYPKINLVNNPQLMELIIQGGNLQGINLSSNILLQYLTIINSLIIELDISQNINLKKLYLKGNSSLTKTYVWTLPLPSDVTVEKDSTNILYKKP